MPGSNRNKRKREGKAGVEEMSSEDDCDHHPDSQPLLPTALSAASNVAMAHAAARDEEEATTMSLDEDKIFKDLMCGNEYRERIIETVKTEYRKCQAQDNFQGLTLTRKVRHLMPVLDMCLADVPDANLPTKSDVCFMLNTLASATSGENNLDATNSESKSDKEDLLKFNKALIKNGIKNHNDPNNVLDKFSNHLNKCSRLILEAGDRYYAAYTVLFQSSGMGKTHLLLKTLERRYGMYLCFRSIADSLNYPPRSPIADWVVGNTEHWRVDGHSIFGYPMLRFASIIIASQKLFENWKSKTNENELTPKTWLDHMEGNDGFQTFGKKHLEGAQNVMETVKTMKTNEVFDYMEAFSDNQKTPFLFCIDEGRELLPNNAFQDVRRCFKTSYAQSKHYFGVFTDTLSTLINFAPHRSTETTSSSRAFMSNSGDHLLPPFWNVLNIDAGITTDGSLKMENYGRPLWKRYAEELRQFDKNPNKIYPDIQKFARVKLLKNEIAELHQMSVDKKKVASLACLACRASIFVSPGRRLAGELVGGHMGVCCHVYEEREAMIVGYPSEPVLADASAAVLKAQSLMGWKTALPELHRAIETAEVDTGKVGELVQRIIFLLAIDCANQTNDGKVTAQSFLETLVGEDAIPKNIPNLKEIFVDFNHFVQLSMVAEESKCVECIQRKAAVACKVGQKGIDQEIYLVDKDGNHAGTLVSQTKNCTTKYDAEYPDSAGWKMSSRFALHGSNRCNEQEDTKKTYLALYHNVGYTVNTPSKKTVVFKKEEQQGHNWKTHVCCPPARFELVGLDIPLFDIEDNNSELQQNLLDIKSTLKAIVNLGRNPIDRLPKQHRTTAQTFFPVTY
jgi:hypothetical protein